MEVALIGAMVVLAFLAVSDSIINHLSHKH
jgi:hypothetical protein